MGDPCTTPGCPGAVHVYVSDEPLRCDACRADVVLAARRVDAATCCTHLGPPVDPWLRDYGTPEGRAGWIDSQWPSYQSIYRGMRAGQERPEKEARRAAASAWARLRGDPARPRACAGAVPAAPRVPSAVEAVRLGAVEEGEGGAAAIGDRRADDGTVVLAAGRRA